MCAAYSCSPSFQGEATWISLLGFFRLTQLRDLWNPLTRDLWNGDALVLRMDPGFELSWFPAWLRGAPYEMMHRVLQCSVFNTLMSLGETITLPHINTEQSEIRSILSKTYCCTSSRYFCMFQSSLGYATLVLAERAKHFAASPPIAKFPKRRKWCISLQMVMRGLHLTRRLD